MWNASALFHDLNHVRETGQVSRIRIEALSTLVAVVLSFLVVFGSWRRWSANWFIQKGVMAAYIMSFSLVTYTIGLMQSAKEKVDVYPIWAVCFLTVFGCTSSITAYSLDDNYLVWRHVIQYGLSMVYALLILFSVADAVSFVAVFLMLAITLVKIYLRAMTSFKVTRDWFWSKITVKCWQSSLYKETETNLEDYDPVSMKGYRYLVGGKLKTRGRGTSFKPPQYAVGPDDLEVITIEEIWQECNKDDEGPLSSSVRACKDICLSYSLFQLLLARFFGYTIVESTPQKARDFVFKGLLLPPRGEGEGEEEAAADYRRAFEVIEVELALLYDFFFTKYGTVHPSGMMAWAVASAASMLTVMALTVIRTLGTVSSTGSHRNVHVSQATYADTSITVLILLVLAFARGAACVALLDVQLGQSGLCLPVHPTTTI